MNQGKKLRILHIADLDNVPFRGVSVVVPQHILYQDRYADVSLMNISNIKVDDRLQQIPYEKGDKNRMVLDDVDVVVFHEVFHPEYIGIARWLIERKISYIIVPHGSLTKSALKIKSIKKSVALRSVFKSFLGKAAALQCLSEYEKKETKMVIEKFVATNGMELPMLHKEQFHRDCIDIIYVGRISAFHKGLDCLVEAVSKISDVCREFGVHIDIIGADVYGSKKKLQGLIDRNEISDIVSMKEALVGQAKEERLLNADIYIQTSRFEGMPLGILEALSYGLPCLVTEGTTLGDTIDKYNAGWVALNDTIDIADKLKEAIYAKDNYKNMADNARKLIEEQFDWNSIAKSTVSFYEFYMQRRYA